MNTYLKNKRLQAVLTQQEALKKATTQWENQKKNLEKSQSPDDTAS